MLKNDFTIINRLGLHARAAAQLVQKANQFVSEVTIFKEDIEVNGKSIMGLMMLAAGQGSRLTFRVVGDGSEELLAELVRLFDRRFEEA